MPAVQMLIAYRHACETFVPQADFRSIRVRQEFYSYEGDTIRIRAETPSVAQR